MVLVAGVGLAAALGGCATARPTTPPAPEPRVAPAPVARPTPAAPAASTPTAAYPPPPAYTPIAVPPGVGPYDPKVDEAIGGLDSKMPSGCRKYVDAWCRTTTIPDAYRLQLCAGYVAAINSFVTQMRQNKSGSAIDACDAMAQGSLPK